MPYFRFCLILNALGTIGTIKKQAGKFNFGILQCLFQKKNFFFVNLKFLIGSDLLQFQMLSQ